MRLFFVAVLCAVTCSCSLKYERVAVEQYNEKIKYDLSIINPSELAFKVYPFQDTNSIINWKKNSKGIYTINLTILNVEDNYVNNIRFKIYAIYSNDVWTILQIKRSAKHFK